MKWNEVPIGVYFIFSDCKPVQGTTITGQLYQKLDKWLMSFENYVVHRQKPVDGGHDLNYYYVVDPNDVEYCTELSDSYRLSFKTRIWKH